MSSTTASRSTQAAHHFENLEHQHASGKLGVWLFLATEILMFGGLIVGYIIMNGVWPDMFALGAEQLDWRLGALNTVLLLTSSYTMAVGVHSAQTNNNNKCFWYLIVTILCGLGFMCVKYIEYSGKLSHGLAPGHFFDIEAVRHYSQDLAHQMAAFLPDASKAATEGLGVTRPHMGMYFAFYFCMTGLHALHVLAGMALIAWAAWRARRKEFSSKYYTAVEGVGLFWHLVDLVWIYLFPLLYLVG